MKKIQILGTGCPKCKKLAENAEAAVKDLGGEFEIEKVTEINEIMKFGVMVTPALAVEGQVKDWAAYIFPVPGKSHEKEQHLYKTEGSKIPQEIAELLFPTWTELTWRD